MIELDCVWIGTALQPDIDITGEHKWFDVRRKTIQHVSQLTEKSGSYGG